MNQITPCPHLAKKWLLSATMLLLMLGMANAEELKLSKTITVEFDGFGTIKSISTPDSILASSGRLVAKLEGVKIATVQGWGSVLHNKKVKCDLDSNEFNAQGTLTARDVIDVPKLDFKLHYKKVEEGVLSIRAEVVTTDESRWVEPVYFLLSIPAATFQEANLMFETQSGEEKTFTIGPDPLDMKGCYGMHQVMIVKGKQKIIMTPAEGSQITAMDSRAWNPKEYKDLVFLCEPKREGKGVTIIPAGQQDDFSMTISFKNED